MPPGQDQEAVCQQVEMVKPQSDDDKINLEISETAAANSPPIKKFFVTALCITVA